MKTRGQLWETRDFYTKGITEQSRKLAYAVAAICWFFRSGGATDGEVIFPSFITVALLFVVLFFICDLSQYLGNAIKLERWIFKKELEIEEENGRHARDNDEMTNPPSIYRLGDFFFYSKLASLFLSFLFLILEFTQRLFFS